MSDGKVNSLIGLISGTLTFLGAWGYCTVIYGFLLGFGLGWLPAAILGVIVGFLMMFLWPLVLLGIVALVWLAVTK